MKRFARQGSLNKLFTEVELPVGEGKVKINVPNLLSYEAPEQEKAADDVRAEVRKAIQNPIGTPRLEELAAGKKNAAIVVNDITRPYAGEEMILELAEELNRAGLKDEQIFLIVAYGIHRINTDEELLKMFGEEVVGRFRFVHHRADVDDALAAAGKNTKNAADDDAPRMSRTDNHGYRNNNSDNEVRNGQGFFNMLIFSASHCC